MKRSAEQYARIRSRVDSGKIPCGSGPHCALMDFEQEIARLPPRERDILRMAERGWTHLGIAEAFGLSRSRISHIVGEFLDWQEN